MASPYRGGGGKRAPAVGDDGIVGDLVRQFADPYAFYRELVQNAIDAEATRIDVRVGPGDAGLRCSVRDDGEGMNPDVLENRLLVLFRSGKEGQEGKIGKFGVGFVSVLAMKPERVVVTTSRGDGTSWTLHLHPDHTYDLFESGGGQRGTTVALDLARPSEEIDEVVARSRASLRTWCRHASVPIRLHAHEADERIDEPLSLREEALLEVVREEGSTRVVIGVPKEEGATYAGFFNHGLMLFETPLPFDGPLGATCFKVQDASLEHTLSRDNVRRDGAFKRAMRVVQSALEEDLVRDLEQAITDAARDGQLGRHGALLARLRHERARIPLARKRIEVPLMHGGSARLGDLTDRATFALEGSGLTRILSEEGHAVVTARHLDTDERALLQLPHAPERVTLVQPVAPDDADRLLLDHLLAALGTHRAPSEAQLVELWGAGAATVFVGGPARDARWISFERLRADPFRMLRRPALLLNTRMALVAHAREKAAEDPELAAALLARVILRMRGALDDDTDLALTEQAIESVLGSS